MKRLSVFFAIIGVFLISIVVGGGLFWRTFWVLPNPNMLGGQKAAAEVCDLADRLIGISAFKCENVEFAENYGKGEFYIIGSLREVVKKEDILASGFVQCRENGVVLPSSINGPSRLRFERIFLDASVYSRGSSDKMDVLPDMYLFIDHTSKFFILRKI